MSSACLVIYSLNLSGIPTSKSTNVIYIFRDSSKGIHGEEICLLRISMIIIFRPILASFIKEGWGKRLLSIYIGIFARDSFL